MPLHLYIVKAPSPSNYAIDENNFLTLKRLEPIPLVMAERAASTPIILNDLRSRSEYLFKVLFLGDAGMKHRK